MDSELFNSLPVTLGNSSASSSAALSSPSRPSASSSARADPSPARLNRPASRTTRRRKCSRISTRFGSSVIQPGANHKLNDVVTDVVCNANNNNSVTDDNGSIPDSFYTNGGLKLRVVWTISSLIAASARHYLLLQPIISEHKTLESLVLTDADGQGVLYMNRDQLEELRVKPLSASSASKRTLVPALNMRLWYAPHLELPHGVMLKGATLVAIRPSEQSNPKKEVSDLSWVSTAFEEPYGTAAKMLVKRRTYCLEMNSF